MASLEIVIVNGEPREYVQNEEVLRDTDVGAPVQSGSTPTFDYGGKLEGGTMSYSSVSEPVTFYIPPEVQAQLGMGVNPFASVTETWTGTSPSPTQPGQGPLPAGSGGLSGIGGLASPQTVPTLAVTAAVLPPPAWLGGPAMSLPEWMASGVLGAVRTSTIHNRQITGVRKGTLPMVVMRGGRGGV